MEEEKKELKTVSNETTSQIKDLQWVPLYLAWDEEKQTVKMKVDKKEDFAMAAGLLFRVTEQAIRNSLTEKVKEVENESSESSK